VAQLEKHLTKLVDESVRGRSLLRRRLCSGMDDLITGFDVGGMIAIALLPWLGQFCPTGFFPKPDLPL
jgi:hypothetical protein